MSRTNHYGIIKIKNKNNKKCPKCKEPMIWIEGLLIDGYIDRMYGRYSCDNCNLSFKSTESRAAKKGRRLAQTIRGLNADNIKEYPVAVQIGILRELQK